MVLALKSLSLSKYKKNGILKGGTSLSKAYNLIKRFSEDIDIAVINDEGDAVGGRGVLKQVEKALTSNETFTEDNDHDRVRKDKWLRQSVYNYPRLTTDQDFGQVAQHLFIDASRISPGLPFEERSITSYINDFLSQTEQNDVITEFELEVISVNTLTIERTFAEKFGVVVKLASAALADTQPIDRLKAGIRHIYDLHLLLQEERIQHFLAGESQVDGLGFNDFMARVLQDDSDGNQNLENYNDYMNANFSECLLYSDIQVTWKELKPTYEGAFSRMLFQTPPPPTSEQIVESLFSLKEMCEGFDKWKGENKVTF